MADAWMPGGDADQSATATFVSDDRIGGWSRGRMVVVGDVMVDVVARPTGPLRTGSDTASEVWLTGGGSAANTAAWVASRLRPVALVAAVGDDALGAAARRDLAGLGVRTEGVVTVAGVRTGTCVVLVDPTGERTMLPDRGANDDLSPHDVEAVVRGADVGWLHLSGYTVLHDGSRAAGVAALAAARDRGIPTSVDPSSAGPILDLGADLLADLLRPVDLLFANEDEVAALGGEDAALSIATAVVVKRGAAGATWTDGVRRVDVAAVPVEVVDTTGAGDAFTAGFLTSWDGSDVEAALAGGAAVAAEVVSRPGARPDPPPRG
jgi:sugar/nucleoside kinase (ribokinase family)